MPPHCPLLYSYPPKLHNGFCTHSVKVSVTTITMLKFDGDGHGDGMCNRTLTIPELRSVHTVLYESGFAEAFYRISGLN